MLELKVEEGVVVVSGGAASGRLDPYHFGMQQACNRLFMHDRLVGALRVALVGFSGPPDIREDFQRLLREAEEKG